MKLCPLGMVPALRDDTSRMTTQADAILKCIAARHPEANLGAENGAAAEFEMDEALAFLTGDVHPARRRRARRRRRRTIADAYAFAMVRWTENFPKTWRDYPAVKVFMENTYADPGAQSAMKTQGFT